MQAYIYTTSVYLLLQAVPLYLAPRLVVLMFTGVEASSTEISLCQSQAVLLLTLALLIIPITGSIPLSSMVGESEEALSGTPSPYSTPTIIITTLYHAITLLRAYTSFASTAASPFSSLTASQFAIVSVGTILTSWGIGLLVFGAGTHSRRSGWLVKDGKVKKSRDVKSK